MTKGGMKELVNNKAALASAPAVVLGVVFGVYGLVKGLRRGGPGAADSLQAEAPPLPVPEPSGDLWEPSLPEPSATDYPTSLPDALDIILVDAELAVSVGRLFQLLFGEQAFQEALDRKLGYTNVTRRKWLAVEGEPGVQARQVNEYVSPIRRNLMGPTEAYCREEQACQESSSGRFVIRRRVYTPKVPYGNTFHTELQWTAVAVSPRISHLQISCRLVFTAKPIAKSIVERLTVNGVQRAYQIVEEVVREFVAKEKEGAAEGVATPFRDSQGDPMSQLGVSSDERAAGQEAGLVRHVDARAQGSTREHRGRSRSQQLPRRERWFSTEGSLILAALLSLLFWLLQIRNECNTDEPSNCTALQLFNGTACQCA